MTEYHHRNNGQVYRLFQHCSLWLEMTRKILLLVDFHIFEALNGGLEVQFFQGFIFTPYQRH